MSIRTIGRAALAWSSAALLLAVAAAGCGSSGPQTGRVSGKITHKGEPLTKGNITFVPNAPDTPNAVSPIGPDGTYELTTSEYGRGAVVGDYKVAISGLAPSDILDYIPKEPVARKSPLSPKYEDTNTSGLTAKVERGSNTYNFDLD